jgi:CRISPR-associated protein Csd1
MSVLQALADRYDRMAADGEAPSYGFAPANIHYTIVLSADGEVCNVQLQPRDSNGHLVKQELAPQAPNDRRGEKIVAGAFWDPSDYALGIPRLDPKASEIAQAKLNRKALEKHSAFRARHSALLSDTDDVGLIALKRFIAGWSPEKASALPNFESLPSQNIAFRLDGERGFIHDRAAARRALDRESGTDEGEAGTCLVTGEVARIARLHPPIKGVGDKLAPLVSFNEDAFDSYGRTKGYNAPVSESAAFAYATALNGLISARDGVDAKGRPRWRNRIGLGDDTVVYWAETAEVETIVGQMFAPPPPDEISETAEMRAVMERLEAGRPVREAAPNIDEQTKVYILGLSPNAARLSVRFWIEGSFGNFAHHFQDHWADMRLEPPPRAYQPAVWALLYELAPLRKIDDGSKHLAGEMMRSILTGAPYPGSLLAQALMRVRSENSASPLRVAIIKAVLTRRARRTWKEARRQDPAHPDWKDRLMALNREEMNVGYRLGRLFAVFDAAQFAGLGRKVNAGVKEKFFGSASATPRHVFPSLLRGAQDHLSAARKKGHAGRAARLENEMSEIVNGFESPGLFPAVLAQEEQGAFVVGFYHQDAELRIPRVKNEIIPDPETDDTIEEED